MKRYSSSALLHIEKYVAAGMKIQLDHDEAADLPVLVSSIYTRTHI
jgi:hypothetical protein